MHQRQLMLDEARRQVEEVRAQMDGLRAMLEMPSRVTSAGVPLQLNAHEARGIGLILDMIAGRIDGLGTILGCIPE